MALLLKIIAFQSAPAFATTTTAPPGTGGGGGGRGGGGGGGGWEPSKRPQIGVGNGANGVNIAQAGKLETLSASELSGSRTSVHVPEEPGIVSRWPCCPYRSNFLFFYFILSNETIRRILIFFPIVPTILLSFFSFRPLMFPTETIKISEEDALWWGEIEVSVGGG